MKVMEESTGLNPLNKHLNYSEIKRPAPDSRGWAVAMAALGINLILGILYSWSLIQKALVNEWGWTNTEASLPYTLCLVTFSIVMIFAGRAQDTYGPKPVSVLGGIFLGAGLILSVYALVPVLMIITFGVIGGTGIGLGFSAGTPCAMKWFEPKRKGIIAGIVVSGVGLSPVYIAPLTDFLLRTSGIQSTFVYLGIFALTGISLLSLILQNPPPGYIPASPLQDIPVNGMYDHTWQEMLRSPKFILLWTSFLMSSAAGLMLIGHLANIAAVQANWQAGFILVAILAVFNAFGRITGGYLSDITGRTNALFIVFLIQAANMFLFTYYQSIPALIAGSVVAGLAYGALFALFPAATADFFGLKNLGVNYGLVFTGFGVAGIVGPVMGGLVADITGAYTVSYIISAGMLLTGAYCCL
jgi:MFS transporter, OFA family, oxalate/formate antiporter